MSKILINPSFVVNLDSQKMLQKLAGEQNWQNQNLNENPQITQRLKKVTFGNVKLLYKNYIETENSQSKLQNLQNSKPNSAFDSQNNSDNFNSQVKNVKTSSQIDLDLQTFLNTFGNDKNSQITNFRQTDLAKNSQTKNPEILAKNYDKKTEIEQKLQQFWNQKKILESQIVDLKFENWQVEQKLSKFQEKYDSSWQNWQQEKLEILKQRAFWQQKSREKSQELTKIQIQIKDLQELTVKTQMDKIYWQEQNITWQSRWTFYTTKWLKQEEKWQENLNHNQREFILQIKEIESKVLQRERIWLGTIAIIFGILAIFSLYFFRV